jgi:transposase
MTGPKRQRVEPTDDWNTLLPLFWWPEQEEYEKLRQPVLFGTSIAERAAEVGVSESTLRRNIEGFRTNGMDSLYSSEKARRKQLPPIIRRFIVDLKAEHPPFNTNEIVNIVDACFGRKPDVRSVKRVLDEEPTPLKIIRNYPPYHEMVDVREGRAAIVELRLSGWSAKAIAGCLSIHRSTVYRTLDRWKEEGVEGLEDKPFGRPTGVRKVTFAAIEAVRKLAKNPELGAYRVHAALEQQGFKLSRATCGRILAQIREVYGYEKPKAGSKDKQEMPFASSTWHEYWSADVRYLDDLDENLLDGGNVYVISIMENYSRAILWSAVTRRQDLPAFLSVLYRAVERYGAPEAFVTDSGSVFLANRAKRIYEALDVDKKEIEKGEPWQNYSETTFNIQRRMADWHFARAKNWSELLEEHRRWWTNYNAQRHAAHEQRTDGRRSPEEVLSWVSGMRFHPKDLARAFFSEHFTRKLDGLGYVTFQRWRLYGEEALARKEAVLWLGEETLSLEYGRETLSSYEVKRIGSGGSNSSRGSGGAGKLQEVRKPTLYETSYTLRQLRLFDLAQVLGDTGWLKALKLEEYTPQSARHPQLLQQVLFPYTEAI